MASISFGDNNSGVQVAENSGSIKAEIHLPPERPESPPSPLSTIPFARDRDFVSRDLLLRQIREKNSVPGSRIALVGLGGVGKSQLAIEYSYRIRSESPEIWVFWVHASNEARFEQSFRDIADQVKIPGRQHPKANIFKLVENWLQDEKKGKWICILDNADDFHVLCSLRAGVNHGASTKELTNTTTKPLIEYIPRSRNGSTIITSRSREVALWMVKHTELIQVDPMESTEALALFRRTLDQPDESHLQESLQLVEELEFMPLAIVQAASFIRNRAPLSSVPQYLRDFQRNDREATKLLKKEAAQGYVGRDWEANNSILMTWQISFDHIRYRKRSAAELLSLMSFFDRQGIPKNLIRLKPKAGGNSRREHLDDSSDGEMSGSDGDDEFEDDITTLRNYSFISVVENDTGTSFTMHRLVQLTTRAWLKSYGEMDQWRGRFIGNLCEEFPTGEYENWEKCRSLFPHVRSAISQQPESQESLLRWATLLYRGASYASKSGNIADAGDMASRSRRQRIKLLGAEDEEALASTAMLAEVYLLAGRWEEAEQLNMQVMETRKTKLGVDHPDTLDVMSNLASTYWNQGRWEEAEQLEGQVMETRKTKLGVDHPSTLKSMSNLASTYRKLGRWEEAEQLQVYIRETHKAKLGADHPDTLAITSNLASTYRNQGRLAEAEQLEVKVMETRKTKLGVDHPDTLTIMSNLASTYKNQGRLEEAEQLEVYVMETRKAKLGMDHPDTLTSMANLAFTWKTSGHHTRGLRLLRRCVDAQMFKLKIEHHYTKFNSQALQAWETEASNI